LITLAHLPGYFRNVMSNKNNAFNPYSHYEGHFVLGVIYQKSDDVADSERVHS